jgi:hypothetical protein
MIFDAVSLQIQDFPTLDLGVAVQQPAVAFNIDDTNCICVAFETQVMGIRKLTG